MLVKTIQKNDSYWHYQRMKNKIKHSYDTHFKCYTFQKEDVIEWVKKQYKPRRKKRKIIYYETQKTWWQRAKDAFATLLPPKQTKDDQV